MIEWKGLYASTPYSSANNKAQDDAVVGMQDTIYVTGPGYGGYSANVRVHNASGAVVALIPVSGGGGALSAPAPVRILDDSTTYSYSLEVVRGAIPSDDADKIVIRIVGGASKRYPGQGSTLPNGSTSFAGPLLAPPSIGARSTNRVALFGNSIGVDSFFPRWKLNTLGAWQPYAGISLDGTIHPTHLDLRDGVVPLSYKCTTAGTTGAKEPEWPTVAGGTVLDGTVVWTAIDDYAAFYQRPGGWNIAQALTGQKFDEVFLVGASGQNSAAILSYHDAALATKPNVMVYLHLWENDINQAGQTLESIKAKFAAFEDIVRSDLLEGRLVVLGTALPMAVYDSPTAFSAYTAGEETKMYHWVNDAIRKLSQRSGCYLADISSAYIDPNWANPVWPDNTTTFVIGSGATQKYTRDGAHPLLAGHFAIAKILAKTLESMPGSKISFSAHGAYQSFSLNPLNYGTSGTGTNVAGTIADKRGWNATVAGATASIEQRTDGVNGKWNRIQGAFSATSKVYCYSSETVTIPDDALSVPLQGVAEIKVAANPVKLQEVIVGFSAAGKGMASFSFFTAEVEQMIGQFITEDTLFTLKTPPAKMPPTATLATIYPVISTTGSGASYDIRIGRAEIRRAAT